MGKPNFSDEFKRGAMAQVTERGYSLAEVSQRLSVSQHSLYRKLRDDLRDHGETCCQNRVTRLTRLAASGCRSATSEAGELSWQAVLSSRQLRWIASSTWLRLIAPA